MFKKAFPLFLLIALSSMINSFQSCSIPAMKPTAFGKPGQLLVIAEKNIWNGVVGEVFREYFDRPFPVLPQPEPIFEIKYASGTELKDLQKEWRTIVMLGDISQDNATSRMLKEALGSENLQKAQQDKEFNLAFREDFWADNQLTVYLFGNSEEQLMENIKARSAAVEAKLLEKDLSQISAEAYQGGSNLTAIKKVKDTYGVYLNLPLDFKIAISDSTNNTIWLRRETRNSSSNILMKVFDYSEESTVSRDNLIALRNLLGREYITTAQEGAYMTTDSINLPIIYRETSLKNRYAIEARGIWAMENDFMGGAFISYLVYDPNKEKVIFLDGFVYAPEQDKRPMMQRFEVIFDSLDLVD